MSRSEDGANDPLLTPEGAARVPKGPPTARVLSWDEARVFINALKRRNCSLVLANGCFDLIHGGHVSYLEAAATEGDILLVGVNSDRSEREIKGPDRPVIPEQERAELIAGMGMVDAVVIFDEPTCERLLREFRPDVHAKGTDYTAESVPERQIADELGIRVAITGAPKENASKDIIQNIRKT